MELKDQQAQLAPLDLQEHKDQAVMMELLDPLVLRVTKELLVLKDLPVLRDLLDLPVLEVRY